MKINLNAKRICVLVLCMVCALAMCLPVMAESQPETKQPDVMQSYDRATTVTAEPGDQVVVTMGFTSTLACAVTLNVEYDTSALTYVSGSGNAGGAMCTIGSERISMVSTAPIPSATFTYTFCVNDDAPAGTYTIALVVSVCADVSYNPTAGKTTGAVITVVRPNCTHPSVSMQVLSAVAATCTEDGLTEGQKCSLCGTVLLEQTVIPAPGHTVQVIDAVPGTCTVPGITEGAVCSVCNAILQTPSFTGTVPHNETVLPAVKPTCTEDGLTEGLHCSMCGEVYTAQESIPATGHTETILPAVPATHLQSGLTEGLWCPVCGATLTAQETIPMLVLEQMILPEDLLTIGVEAFKACAAECIILPEGCTEIAARAFADCAQLLVIEIPETVKIIDPTAFDGCSEQLIIVAPEGSVAAEFAAEIGLQWVALTK